MSENKLKTTAPTTGRTLNFAMSGRDLINIGIFAALVLVIALVLRIGFSVMPLLVALVPQIIALICGIVMILFFTRVRHAGMVFTLGLLISIFMAFPHGWQTLLFMPLGALLAEVCLWAGKYRSKLSFLLAYACFSLWGAATLTPLYVTKDYWLGQIEKSLGSQGRELFAQLASWPMLLTIIATTFLCGIIGGLIGLSVLKKHFQRAGIA